MMAMVEVLARYLADGNWPAVAIVGVIVGTAIVRLLYSLITEIKERKNNDLKGALETDGLSNDVRFVIQESLNRTYFYRATGIPSDHYIRSKIRRFLEKSQGDITLFTVRRSSGYIYVEDGKLLIKFGRLDRFEYYWQIITSIVLILICLFGFVVLVAKWDVSEGGKLTLAVVSALGLLLSLYSLWKAGSFRIARNIVKPAFEDFEKVLSEVDDCDSHKSVEMDVKQKQVSPPLKVVG